MGTLEQLARTLSAQCSQAGLALYLPESYASLAPDCRVLVSSVVTSGTLSRRLEYAMERWGADRVVLAVEAAAEDFPLPADGRGSPLGPERLQELMDRLEPAVFFDRGLCAHYFTYMPGPGRPFCPVRHPRSVRSKLDLAQRLGLYGALLAAPEVGGWLGEIFSDGP